MLTDTQIKHAGRAILEYRPLPAPRAFHQSQAKFRWIFGGNRTGKSENNIGYDLCAFALGVHPFRETAKSAGSRAAAKTGPLGGKVLGEEKTQGYGAGE